MLESLNYSLLMILFTTSHCTLLYLLSSSNFEKATSVQSKVLEFMDSEY